ncbi:MAG: addiction module protein [Opitutaceae bacterium]|nr:addiction module protein [Opitutaceae bacterium]
MSKAEILTVLPQLSLQERSEILDYLWSMEETSGPTMCEQTILNGELASYEAHPAAGTPWSEVKARLYAFHQPPAVTISSAPPPFHLPS